MYPGFRFCVDKWRLGLRVAGLIVTIAASIATAFAGELTQYFPVQANGQAASVKQSGWRIKWRVLEPETHNYGGSAVWQFDSIEFMKGRLANGREDWIKVLNKLAMAEMYVPYNDGETAFFDIQNFTFGLVPVKPSYLPKFGVIKAQKKDRYVVATLINEGLRWMDGDDNVRHGQALRMWATLKAGNYSYVMVYTFSDDGKISVRVAGTANNYHPLDANNFASTTNKGTHAHMGAWRMEFDLGRASANRVEIVERIVNPTTGIGRVNVRPFNGGREGGEAWSNDKFTVVKITNKQTRNRHVPPQNVAYVLKTSAGGRLRSKVDVTEFDYWVTRRVPDDRRRPAPELKFAEVPKKLRRPEPIEDRAVVLWHSSTLQHIPRGEDFGPSGYEPHTGAALLAYAGFDLIPVHLWHKTPFFNANSNGGDGGGNDQSSDLPPGGEPITQLLRPAGRGRPRSRGPQVRTLQHLLNIAVDGDYGPATKRAVETFQRDNGLDVDGIAGPQTVALLRNRSR